MFNYISWYNNLLNSCIHYIPNSRGKSLRVSLHEIMVILVSIWLVQNKLPVNILEQKLPEFSSIFVTSSTEKSPDQFAGNVGCDNNINDNLHQRDQPLVWTTEQPATICTWWRSGSLFNQRKWTSLSPPLLLLASSRLLTHFWELEKSKWNN